MKEAPSNLHELMDIPEVRAAKEALPADVQQYIEASDQSQAHSGDPELKAVYAYEAQQLFSTIPESSKQKYFDYLEKRNSYIPKEVIIYEHRNTNIHTR